MSPRERILAVSLGLAGLGLVVLTYHAYTTDSHDQSWTDPHQPPTNVDVPVWTVPMMASRTAPVGKCYPGSLMDWDGCVVGDC